MSHIKETQVNIEKSLEDCRVKETQVNIEKS